MRCVNCKFYQRGPIGWNNCKLMKLECFYEYVKEPCEFIDDNYTLLVDFEQLGFVKGEKASEKTYKVKSKIKRKL